MQTFAAKDGQYNRHHFFGQNPQLARLVEGMSDEQIDGLRRGGHDLVKIYAAYAAAAGTQGRPTVILADREHTSELQSLMRISYAVFCLKKTNQHPHIIKDPNT